MPDVVVLLELPVHEAHARLAPGGDRMEREERAFHERVARGFRELAAADAERWVTVDAAGSVDEVADRVLKAVRARVEV